MNLKNLNYAVSTFAAFLAMFPSVGFAQQFGTSEDVTMSYLSLITVGILLIFITIGLTKAWSGIMHLLMPNAKKKKSKDGSAQFLPEAKIVLGTVLASLLLFLFSLKTVNGLAPFNGPNGARFTAAIFIILAVVGTLVRLHWPRRSRQYAFGVIIGTVVTFILIGFKHTLFSQSHQDPFVMAMGMVCIVIAWRFLFGPWNAKIKAVVLGTFLFWVGMHLILREDPTQRSAHLMATGIALVPAMVWCALFLEYHKQRWSLVFLMFFAGMLSTAPILFYDRMVRSGVELQFFLFRIVPENFTYQSSAFVSGNVLGIHGLQSTVMSTLISFMIVGLIEEFSKYWVLRKSGEHAFRSIDDVIQLGIIVAIGFAFAENVLNPTYFISFVREFLVKPESPQWSAFIGNVMGRAILTNMVHILSTGIMGYFLGLALYAKPYLREVHRKGKRFLFCTWIHRVLRLPEKHVFKTEMLLTGFVTSLVLHGFFNFMVTLPDILPGNPRTIGDILGSPDGSFWHLIAILVLPSLFYVVGGFWILSTLFYKKTCMKERGHLVQKDTFVMEQVMG